ncbi:hypothetical protein, partial [Xanthomonas axonopodis]|uniref:hypothetical protein n=1 Tax=Xanthomonas axonopodis TaxID=53413 RepID=UPI00117FBFD8
CTALMLITPPRWLQSDSSIHPARRRSCDWRLKVRANQEDPCRPWHDALVGAIKTRLRIRQTGATGLQQRHVWGHTPPLRTLTALA